MMLDDPDSGRDAPANAGAGGQRTVQHSIAPAEYPRDNTRAIRISIAAIIAVMVLVIWAAVAISIYFSREAALAEMKSNATNLAFAFDDEVTHILDNSVRTMDAVAARMRAKGSDMDIYAWARDIPIVAGPVIVAGIIAPDGMLVSSTRAPDMKPVDMSDREHFRIHLDGKYKGVFIGKPVTSRTDNQILIPITERIETRDGRFVGVLNFELSPALLTKLHQSIDLGEHGTITLIGLDNIVRARFSKNSPEGLDGIGESLRGNISREIARGENQGFSLQRDTLDHVERLHSFRRVANYPLIVSVGLGYEEGMASWWKITTMILIVAAGATLFLGGLAFYLTREIAVRKVAEEKLARSNILLAAATESSPEGILVVDQEGRTISYNRLFVDMWRLSEDLPVKGIHKDVLQASAVQLKDPETFLARVHDLYEHPDESIRDELEFKDGRSIERHSTVLRREDGEYIGRIWFFRDITSQKTAEAMIEQLARNDPLTGLPNRRVFVEALQQALGRAGRGGKGFAILYLDLDHFKDVNDTLGHMLGDELIKAVGDRLRGGIRVTDVAARFGGDEFAILQTDIQDPADAAVLAGKLLEAMAQPFLLGDNRIQSGTSIGIAVSEPGTTDGETLLSHADLALYRAKAEGRGTYRFFTESMDTEVHARVKLFGELRRAIADGQLTLHYQPQVDVRDGKIKGLEALVRWNHPERGLLLPGKFIHIAELTGLIAPLGRWVMNEACRQMKEWLDAGIAPLVLAVNISATEFKIAGIQRKILAVIEKHGVAPDRIELEITEYAMMEASERSDDVLVRLKECGIGISIDDFGMGYSSLATMKRFRPSRIKIAGEFVSGVLENEADRAVVRAIVEMARELRVGLIAEGVESAAQAKFLGDLGCSEAQGFFYSRALPAGDITALLRRGGNLEPAGCRPLTEVA